MSKPGALLVCLEQAHLHIAHSPHGILRWEATRTDDVFSSGATFRENETIMFSLILYWIYSLTVVTCYNLLDLRGYSAIQNDITIIIRQCLSTV